MKEEARTPVLKLLIHTRARHLTSEPDNPDDDYMPIANPNPTIRQDLSGGH